MANVVFMTVWDGGGTDTYDFSKYSTDLSVSLQPGEWTTASSQQLANLGNGHYATGNIANSLLYKDNPASLIENAIGGAGNDTIGGNAANNAITGGGGNNSIDGRGGTNTAVYSGNASDYLFAQDADGSWKVTDVRAGSPDGVDTLKNVEFLKFKDSTIDLDATTAAGTETPGNGTVDGTNKIYGTSGSDTLSGGTGNDFIDGGVGADKMLGGKGDDIYVVDNSRDVVTEQTNAGNDTVLASITYTLPSNVENLTLTGTAAVNATGNTLANVITGNDAANSLSGLAGNDTLMGLGGNDTLNGGAGADAMFGGSGNDTYMVDNVGDVVNETAGDGTDTVQSSISFSLADSVHAVGAIENLTLTGSASLNATGNALDNALFGNSGANTLIGGAGADKLDGGGGTDTASYATSSSGVSASLMLGVGSAGDAQGDKFTNIENLTGSNFDDTLEGNAGNNKLVGGLGSDTVSYAHATAGTNGLGVTVNLSLTSAQNTARAGTDTLSGFENLTGSEFKDTLRGTSGDNVLTGLGGNDTITGGGGNDTFVFNAGFGKDTITDFGAGPNSGPHDIIAIDQTMFADFDAVMAASAQVGTNTVITVNTQNSITLSNVKMSSLRSDDFVFTGAGGNATVAGGAGNDAFVFNSDVVKPGMTDLFPSPDSGPHDLGDVAHSIFAALHVGMAEVEAHTTIDAEHMIAHNLAKLSSLHWDGFATT